MSQYYAEIQGSRGRASRQGTKQSGMWSHTRGWHIGCEVYCYYSDVDEDDRVRIFLTGGSAGSERIFLGEWSVADLKKKERI